MARPTVMTAEIVERLRQAFAIGCTDEEAAAYAKIAVRTLYDYQRDNEEFLQEKEELEVVRPWLSLPQMARNGSIGWQKINRNSYKTIKKRK